ncbi:hypothetical protein [Spirillospora sp. NPDC048824]|uniref:hypothetical protein n=1 Tax=Spirillospora sp. NPDC048824 TaxID=3364526 RepID=UPI003710090F
MTRPLLLLDVDGVLNPFGSSRCPSGFAEHALFPGEEPVRINPGHGTWITELLDDEPTLLIPIGPATGLTRRSVDQALDWAGDL